MFSMRPESKLNRRSLNRRAFVLGGVQASVLAIIVGRLRYLQVTESDRLTGLAESNRINIRLLVPERGLIHDRNGLQLAINEKLFKILLVKEEAVDPLDTLDQLSRIIPIPDEVKANVLEQIEDVRAHVPIVVVEEANWDQVARVSVNTPALPGVQAAVGERRIYPAGADTAHLIGYVGKVSPSDLADSQSQDPLLSIPDFRVGRIGVEKTLDRELRGRAGNKQIEVNAHGRVMRELGTVGARHGKGHQLTIDSTQQTFARARFGNETGSAVVIDISNGDLISMATAPAFDPNQIVSGITQADFDKLRNDERKPLVYRAIQGVYPPGSTFKMVTALTALEDGLISPSDVITCTGSVEVSSRQFHCWKRSGHGEVSLLKSLRESCDVYYFNLAQRIGLSRLQAMANKLGIGIKPRLPLPGVHKGLFPTEATKLERHNRPWVIGDMLNASIGQGDLLATALQLAIMSARIASGLEVQPRLILSVDGKPQAEPEFPPLAISETHLNLIREGMNAVVNSSMGTAFASRSADESFLIAGKTGTSQVRNISQRERQSGIRSNEDLPFKQRDHALFCCYAPSHAPRYAAAVIVEHGGGGASVAAPIARDLLMRAHYGGIPNLRSYPPEVREEVKDIFLNLKLLDDSPAISDPPVLLRT